MKILQASANRARRAYDMLEVTAQKMEIDLISVSEPNLNLVKNPEWITDNIQNVAILLKNRNRQVEGYSEGHGHLQLRLHEIDIYVCYISPNMPINEYKNIVREIMEKVSRTKREAIILGHFKAKSSEWGGRTTVYRSKIMSKWIAGLNLIPLNKGETPTWQRGGSSSFIDITLVTPKMAKKVTQWQVLGKESLSDHQHIVFEVKGTEAIRKRNLGATRKIHFNKDRLQEAWRCELVTLGGTSIKQCMDGLCRTYRKSRAQKINPNETNIHTDGRKP